ncbi:pirin [Actinotalea ferrariae CF5-4]|uniref:Pirin n=1 Tax=Actinotalea ferrariae CF5-4 TaxID=948458 RepID=A0A021VMS6_9CELL|nr:pirin family protein [Actinotalea ferrariae]EYR62519.1 pirin [Actinotalea ferrariae CF5-4]
MTNLEPAPAEVLCDDRPAAGTAVDPGSIEVLTARDVPLGGPRAMTVRRTLPQRRRSFIGAWCFIDHYGPDDVSVTGGMRVPPHPHTGLQTVSWLFSGEVEHRDSLGTHAFVRPGQLNLMTAGRGISHSEDSTAATTVLHGVQLWTVLPERSRGTDPAFDHHVPDPVALPDGELRVFLGRLAGASSPVATFSPLLGAELVLRAGASWTVDVDPGHEHGVLVDTGAAAVRTDRTAARGERSVGAASSELLYVAPGARTLTIRASDDGDLRVLLLGGLPLGERIVMWWNFIGRDHDEVTQARAQWQAQIGAERIDGGVRFGVVEGHPHPPLPAPPMPNQRLKPRG